jgi:hypothetical protein
MDPKQTLLAQRAKILADAQAAVAKIDRDLAELGQAETIAAKYGLELVPRRSEDAPQSEPSGRGLPVVINDDSGRLRTGWVRADRNSNYRIIQRHVESLILQKGAPIALSEIKQSLDSHGIAVGGQRPMATLSAYLSSNPNLYSIRRGWWGTASMRATADAGRLPEADNDTPDTEHDDGGFFAVQKTEEGVFK